MFSTIREAVADHLLNRNDELVHTVVERTIDELRPSLERQIKDLSVAEARGYVRARARRTVQKHVALVVNEIGGLAAQTQSLISAKSLEQVAHKVVRQAWTRPPAHLGVRMAG